MNNKFIIYQLFPRLLGNRCENCVTNGIIKQNGVGKMNDITTKVLHSIKELGATHVWLTGVIEHATKTDYSEYGIAKDNPYVVKGEAGSPYAIKDYYDIDPDIAEDVANRMTEFENLIARIHKAGLKVLVDFVPNHVARQYHSDAKPKGIADLGENDDTNFGFNPKNNFYYIPRQLFSPHIDLGSGKEAYYEFPAKVTGNDCFSAFPGQNDWYETVKLNYGVDYGNGQRHFSPIPDTWFKMLNILRFWGSKGIDGFRCDMAHLVPIEFWSWAITQVKEKYPELIFIAEIYDVNLYRDYIYNGKFDYLYDKVNLYDTLRGIQTNGTSAAAITSCWQTVEEISEKMLNFLENHDEQRYASQFYAGDANKALPALVVSSMLNNSPFMLYFGQELGERATDAEGFSGYDGRTTIFDYWSVPTVRRWFNNGKCNDENLTNNEIKLRELYSRILHIATEEKAISEGGFFDLMYVNYNNPDFNPHHQYTFIRKHEDEIILIAVNFGDSNADVKINIPEHTFSVMEIAATEYEATELLSGNKTEIALSPNEKFETPISAYGAVIWKFKALSSKKNQKYKSSTSKK